jgi:hypothetical protein
MKYFTGIDTLPLYNYSKVSEDNDLRYLLILQDYFELPVISEKEMQQLFEVWEKINDEIIDFNGINIEYKAILRMQKSIALLKCEMITTGDKSIENIIKLKEIELLNMYPKTKGNIEENIITLEVQLKMQIDMRICTVRKYYGYIKFLTKNKEHEKH